MLENNFTKNIMNLFKKIAHGFFLGFCIGIFFSIVVLLTFGFAFPESKSFYMYLKIAIYMIFTCIFICISYEIFPSIRNLLDLIFRFIWAIIF